MKMRLTTNKPNRRFEFEDGRAAVIVNSGPGPGITADDCNAGHDLTARLRVCNACPEGKVCGGVLRSCKQGVSRATVRDPAARCPLGNW